MTNLPRFGSALTALALVSVIAGCAGPMSRQAGQAAKLHKSDVGLATRAHMALASGDFASAVDLSERAVENQPSDAVLRSLLGNAYFGAGRFVSAEAAYRDSLSLMPNQPQLVLRLSLVQIAQGRNAEAIALLGSARHVVEPADYGLALALAGRPTEAISVLEPAARAQGADSRVRQNLALAYGLAGDWLTARTIARQDLPLDQVGQRIQQWMALSQPTRPSDQIAALVGVTPAAADPGQPVRLALHGSDGTRMAQLSQPAVPAPQSAEPMEVLPPMMAAAPEQAEFIAPDAPVYAPANLADAYAVPEAGEVVLASAADSPVDIRPAAAAPLVAAIAPAPARPKVASTAGGPRAKKAGVVVQLGAYSSATRVEDAWEQFSNRYAGLKNYVPSSARFGGPKGTVYRLSVGGFGSVSEANSLCSSLQQKGKTCFVRRVAGDSPVQFASS